MAAPSGICIKGLTKIAADENTRATAVLKVETSERSPETERR